MTNPYETGLAKNQANFQPLTPLTFLERAASVFPGRAAIVHGGLRRSYAEFYARSRRLASALAAHGISRNDTVTAMLANTPAMLECHYGVPMRGAVLNTLNTRLDAKILAFTLDHAETKALIVDREFAGVMRDALRGAKVKPLVIDYDDPEYKGAGERIGTLDYEELVASGDPEFRWSSPRDEWDAIALNYTSGTTGNPKGVVYHHRGAALLAQGNVIVSSMAKHPVYLWTLPMFHCNGWCFPWSISVVAGTHVCLRQVRAGPIYELMEREGVTHLCGAPIVMSTLLNAPAHEKRKLPHVVSFFTAAAPPPEAVLAAMKEAGFEVTHLYGLTETYGPAVVNDWQSDWDGLPAGEQAAKKARQGVRYGALDALTVMDPETMTPVPSDGETIGEVMFRGNVRDEGLSQERGRNGGSLRGRLVSFGRPRRHSRGRLHPAEGPVQGHHHLGRREHLLDRGRGCLVQASRGRACRRGGEARREMGRNALRLRRAEAGHERDAGRPPRLVPRPSRALQMPAPHRFRRDSQDLDRQGAEILAARAGEGIRELSLTRRGPSGLEALVAP